jgi:hypothetical protein
MSDVVRLVTRSGAACYPWACAACGAISTAYIWGALAAPLATYTVDRREQDPQHCAVCGTLGAEVHHWAPRHLFGDEADDWPVALLCVKCHKRWHDLVTPDMSRLAGRGSLM